MPVPPTRIRMLSAYLLPVYHLMDSFGRAVQLIAQGVACPSRKEDDVAGLESQRLVRRGFQPAAPLRDKVEHCALVWRKLHAPGRVEFASAVGRAREAEIPKYLA